VWFYECKFYVIYRPTYLWSIFASNPNLGYRKRILLNTSSMPQDGAPTMPTWPRDLVLRPPSMFHIIFFRHWSWSGKSFASNSSSSRRVLGAKRDCRQQGLILFIILFLFSAFTASFWHHLVFLGRQNPDRMPRHTFACYVYWRCLVTIYWLSACNVNSNLYSPRLRSPWPLRLLDTFATLLAEINYIFIKSFLCQF
jgi:hypothetical protein